MMKLRGLVLALSLVTSLPVLAVSNPTPSPKDNRVLYVNYDPSNVVQLYGVIGRQTFVMFDRSERIEDLGGGDTSAWEIGVIKMGNGFFIKPKTHLDPDTNITIVTNKRFYNFDMKVSKNRKMYSVIYRYPDQEAARQRSVTKANTVKDLFENSGQTVRNTRYFVQGPESIAPIAAWDDGRFTYLRFAAAQDIPAVYYEDEDGKETLTDPTMKDDETIVIPRMEKKFILRNGNAVACIFNKGWSRYAKFKEYTKTVSPDVKRVIKGAE